MILNIKYNRIRIFVSQDNVKSIIYGKEGDNLMEKTMPSVDQKLHLFGICNKELSCTSCSVHIKTKNEVLKEPQDKELDILYNLNDYRDGQLIKISFAFKQSDKQNLLIELQECHVKFIQQKK